MFTTVKECRCCGGANLHQYLDLGNQPLANSYHKGEELDEFPLEVVLCEDCFHSQLSVVVDPPLMFKHYLYVSGTTETFRNHCLSLAGDAVAKFMEVWTGHTESPRVLDIACNDGTLLGYFKDMGCVVQGVDPAENLRELTEEKGIPVEVGYWGESIAQRFINRDQEFDIITGTNVFAHVDDTAGFLKACYSVLSDEGVVILEFPYCNEMIGKVEFDTIYHEHVSYFLVNSFSVLARRMGFHIPRVIQTEIHGGSIRFFLKKGKGIESTTLLLANELHKGLLYPATYDKFAEAVGKNKAELKAELQDLRDKGYKVIGYGASAKGNTMLNHFEVDLDYIVDDNPMKWGYLTPGRDIPIRSPEDIKDESEDLAIVILSWNFFKEIKEKIQTIRGGDSNDKYILYVPNVHGG